MDASDRSAGRSEEGPLAGRLLSASEVPRVGSAIPQPPSGGQVLFCYIAWQDLTRCCKTRPDPRYTRNYVLTSHLESCGADRGEPGAARADRGRADAPAAPAARARHLQAAHRDQHHRQRRQHDRRGRGDGRATAQGGVSRRGHLRRRSGPAQREPRRALPGTCRRQDASRSCSSRTSTSSKRRRKTGRSISIRSDSSRRTATSTGGARPTTRRWRRSSWPTCCG